MSTSQSAAVATSTVPGAVVSGIGVVLLAIGLIWGVVVGFYPSDLPALLGILVVGMVAATVGQKMYQSAKQKQAEMRIAQRDADGKV